MANASNALEELIGDHLLRSATWSKPSDIYIGLFTVMPSEDGTGGTEVTGGSYARVKYGPGDTYWSSPIGGNGEYVNNTAIQFATPSDNWGDIVGYGLFSAITAGTLYIIRSFPNPITVNLGDPGPEFPATYIKIVVS